MSLRRFVRQLKPIQENKVNYVDAVQNLMEAAKGINIEVLRKLKDGRPRGDILLDVINNQTKVETTKGNRTISWLSQIDKTAMERGDFESPLNNPRKKPYKK